MHSAFTLKHALPDAEGFRALRQSTGWGDISLDQSQSVLAKSLHGITAYKGVIPIGMARLIGDGVLNLYVQDVVIAKAYQGKGVGKAIMQALIKDMRNLFPSDCTIGLLAASGQEGFYSSFSFITRPNTDYGAGMFAKLADLTDGTTS